MRPTEKKQEGVFVCLRQSKLERERDRENCGRKYTSKVSIVLQTWKIVTIFNKIHCNSLEVTSQNLYIDLCCELKFFWTWHSTLKACARQLAGYHCEKGVFLLLYLNLSLFSLRLACPAVRRFLLLYTHYQIFNVHFLYRNQCLGDFCSICFIRNPCFVRNGCYPINHISTIFCAKVIIRENSYYNSNRNYHHH